MAAFRLIALIAALAFVHADTAWCSPAPHRARRAPERTEALSTLIALAQPPGDLPVDDEEEVEEDTTDIFIPPPPPPGQPGAPDTVRQAPPQGQPPRFGAPDSVARPDSVEVVPVPRPAAPDTLRPGVVSPGGVPKPPPPKVRRGVFGIHPAALLAGMVALHIVVVNMVTK